MVDISGDFCPQGRRECRFRFKKRWGVSCFVWDGVFLGRSITASSQNASRPSERTLEPPTQLMPDGQEPLPHASTLCPEKIVTALTKQGTYDVPPQPGSPLDATIPRSVFMKLPKACSVGATHASGTRTVVDPPGVSVRPCLLTARTLTVNDTEASVVPDQQGEPLDAFTAWARSTHSPGE